MEAARKPIEKKIFSCRSRIIYHPTRNFRSFSYFRRRFDGVRICIFLPQESIFRQTNKGEAILHSTKEAQFQIRKSILQILRVITMKFSLPALLLVWASQASAFAPPKPAASATSSSTALYSKFKVFIDGEAGTTGIQVRGRIESRDDLQIISPPSDLRKDEETRKQFINDADVVILCKRMTCILFLGGEQMVVVLPTCFCASYFPIFPIPCQMLPK